jgi:hypothetical protein
MKAAPDSFVVPSVSNMGALTPAAPLLKLIWPWENALTPAANANAKLSSLFMLCFWVVLAS